MSEFRLVFRVHAIQRIFQRKISQEEVKRVVEAGETIATYPTDKPFPSRLILGWNGTRPIHVVAADNVPDRETIIVTVYQPDAGEWDGEFKRRRSR
jgi:hypothetical protein